MTAIQTDTSPRPTIGPLGATEDRASVSALVARSGQVSFKSGQINRDWILEGEPQARSAPLVSARDGDASVNFWDCTAGKFRWHYAWDETVMILDGEVRVTDDTGASSVLRAGDVAHFAAGSVYTWQVDRYVRKIAFHKQPRASFRQMLGRYRRGMMVAASMLGVAALRFFMRRFSVAMLMSVSLASPLLESI